MRTGVRKFLIVASASLVAATSLGLWALRSGRLAGAALDVFEREPLPGDGGFADVPNLLLTPHIAGVTRQSNRRVSALVAANVRRVLRPD